MAGSKLGGGVAGVALVMLIASCDGDGGPLAPSPTAPAVATATADASAPPRVGALREAVSLTATGDGTTTSSFWDDAIAETRIKRRAHIKHLEALVRFYGVMPEECIRKLLQVKEEQLADEIEWLHRMKIRYPI